MPDDEKVDLRIDPWVSIRDLEKKVSEMKEWENYLAHGGLLEQIMDRVERVEKKVDDLNKGLDKCFGDFQDDDNIQTNEISELRDKLDVWRNEANNMITELKERVEGIYKSIHGINDSTLPKVWYKGILPELEQKEPPDDLMEHLDKVIYPYSDKHIVVERSDLEWLFSELFTYNTRNKYFVLKEKYLGADKE